MDYIGFRSLNIAYILFAMFWNNIGNDIVNSVDLATTA